MKKLLLIFLFAFSFLNAQDITFSDLAATTNPIESWIMPIESPAETYKITLANVFNKLLGRSNEWTGQNTFNGITRIDSNLIQRGNHYFASETFSSGWSGEGWRLDYGVTDGSLSNLELDNLTIRGVMSVYELLIKQIRATNGNLLITTSGKVTGVHNSDTTQIIFEDATGNGIVPFAQHDIIRAQKYNNLGAVTKTIDAIIDTIGSYGGYQFAVVTYYTSNHFEKGDEVVRLGNSADTTRQGTIYMSTTDAGSPFLQVLSGIDTLSAWTDSSKVKVHLGNLNSIISPTFGQLTGYGLYSTNAYLDNVYLRGNITILNPEAVADSLSGFLTISTAWDSITNRPVYFDPPSGSGLFLASDHFGYYTGGAWKVYLDDSGNLVLGDIGGGGNGLSWNQTAGTLSVKGSINLTNPTTFINGGKLSLDDIQDGTYGRVLTTSISAGKILLSQVDGDLDDVANGTVYGKILLTDISSGHIKLSETVGTLDDIDDGLSYGRVVVTDLSSGHILLSTTVGDLDDIADGTGYAKVKATYISSGRILLSEAAGDLDDIDDGDTYGKIAATDISSGHITLISSSAALNINSTTYGNDGIQLQYNGGNPRAYIGDGANQYFKFDGTNVSWKGTNSELTAAGAFTATNATITGTVTITNPTTFNNGNPLNTSDLTNNSSWDNTSTALTSGVSLSAGGIVLGTNAVIRSGQTAYNTGKGYWLGVVSGTPKFSIGNSSDNRVTWDGSTLTIAGALNTGTGSSIDGQFVNSLAANKITAGTGIVNNLSVLSTLTMGSAATDGYIQSYGWNGTANGFQIKGGATPAVTIIGGTITGGTIQTGTSGQRVVIDGVNKKIQFYDAAGSVGNLYGSGTYLYFDGDFLLNDNLTFQSNNPIITFPCDAGGEGHLTSASASNGIRSTDNFEVGGSFDIGNLKFIINSSGQITKINNVVTSGYIPISNGTHYEPRTLTTSDLPLSSDYAWTGAHTWTKAVSGSYNLTLTNSETSNTSAIGGFYMKANQGGSAAGAAFQVFSSQYSDAAVAGYARLRTDLAMKGIIFDTGGSGDNIYFKINTGDIANISSSGLTATNLISSGTVKTALNTTWDFGAANVVSPTSPNRTLTVKVGGTTYYIAAKTTND